MNVTKNQNFGMILFALGFRPFYLLAGLFAVLALPVWIATYTGILQWGGHMQGMSWHIHEMIFGFAPAVIAGFLLTAVPNWTRLPTPAGTKLAGLALLWLAARIANITGPTVLSIVLDVAFLPAIAVAVGIPIWRSANRRNLKVLLVLAALTLANLIWHLASISVVSPVLMHVSYVTAIDIITILMAIVGGRVIPAFTRNAVSGSNPITIKSVEVVALGALVLLVLADVFGVWVALPKIIVLPLLVVAALGHLVRLWLWQPLRTRHDPLLLMLPVAYVWIPISLGLRAFSQISDLMPAASMHALTIGAMSSLMVAMMMRSALGHSGRMLTATWVENSVFWLVQTTAIVRVGAALVPLVFYRNAMVVSSVLWTLAFVIFVFGYWKALTQPRVDGRPG